VKYFLRLNSKIDRILAFPRNEILQRLICQYAFDKLQKEDIRMEEEAQNTTASAHRRNNK